MVVRVICDSTDGVEGQAYNYFEECPLILGDRLPARPRRVLLFLAFSVR